MTVFSLLVSQVIDECCTYRQMVMTDFPIRNDSVSFVWVKEQLFYFHSLAIFHFLFETPFCRIIHHFQVKFYYYLHLFIDRIVSYPIEFVFTNIYICTLHKIILFHLYNFHRIINIFHLMIFCIAFSIKKSFLHEKQKSQ